MIILRSNATSVSDVLIPDLGIFIPSGGGEEVFNTVEDLNKIRSSYDVVRLATDDFGDGNPSLVVNDGTRDIPPEEVADFVNGTLQDYSHIWSRSGTYVYVGRRTGAATVTDAQWQVYRYTLGVLGSIVWADGDQNFDNIWADRATLIYT